MIVFVANDKLELSSKNKNFGKLASATMSRTASQYLKEFSDENDGDINKSDVFFDILKWNVSIFGRSA